MDHETDHDRRGCPWFDFISNWDDLRDLHEPSTTDPEPLIPLTQTLSSRSSFSLTKVEDRVCLVLAAEAEAAVITMDQEHERMQLPPAVPVLPIEEEENLTLTSTATIASVVDAPRAVSYTIPTDPTSADTSNNHQSRTIHLYGKQFQQVESESHDANQTGRTPTGLALWPAGKLVADFLACSSSMDSSTSSSPRTVVELGCGLGLCGLVSYALHQQDANENGHVHSQQLVVLTDSDHETLQYARRNVEENADQCSDTDSDTAVRLEILDWCSPADIQRVKRLSLSVESSADDDDDCDGGYDRVLASDVIYEATAPILKEFMYTAKSLLRKSGSLFVLGIRRRTTSLQEVRDAAAAVGLEGGGFVSEFLLDLFDNRLEGDENKDADHGTDNGADDVVNGDGDDADADADEDGSSLFWSQAVLVFWHAGDEVGKGLASTMCQEATKNAANGWLD